jgi:hypothetical protein
VAGLRDFVVTAWLSGTRRKICSRRALPAMSWGLIALAAGVAVARLRSLRARVQTGRASLISIWPLFSLTWM